MSRLNIERQRKLEPKRVQGCAQTLVELGYEPVILNGVKIEFVHQGEVISFWPYSGWHSGKNIQDGRGFKELVNKLKCK